MALVKTRFQHLALAAVILLLLLALQRLSSPHSLLQSQKQTRAGVNDFASSGGAAAAGTATAKAAAAAAATVATSTTKAAAAAAATVATSTAKAAAAAAAATVASSTAKAAAAAAAAAEAAAAAAAAAEAATAAAVAAEAARSGAWEEWDHNNFTKMVAGTLSLQQQQLHRWDDGKKVAVLRQESHELSAQQRIRAARKWLRTSGRVVFAASVRNGMRGLPSTAANLRRLAAQFHQAWFVFVENDSNDATRQFLFNWTRSDSRVRLLGCGTVNSAAACQLRLKYSSGKAHVQGWGTKRNAKEKKERSFLMSAIRNTYLSFVYSQLAAKADLLIVVDPDLTFENWSLDAILQGLYYFSNRPRLDSLCAFTRFGGVIYDDCTVSFFSERRFSNTGSSRFYGDVMRYAAKDTPPVKVDACFQAFTAYRISSLVKRRAFYGPAENEEVCEHKTLSRQLRENYLDINMRLRVKKQNEGSL